MLHKIIATIFLEPIQILNLDIELKILITTNMVEFNMQTELIKEKLKLLMEKIF